MFQTCKLKSLSKALVMAILSGGLVTSATAQTAEDMPAISYTKVSTKSGKKPSKKVVSGEPSSAIPDGAIVISDRDFNRFLLPAPIKAVHFPEDTPISGKPIYLAKNTQVMFQVKRGSDKPIEMVVEMTNDTVREFSLLPRPVKGITFSTDGASASAALKAARPPLKVDADGVPTPRSEDIDLLKKVAMGATPQGMDAIKLAAPTRFDKFTVVPLAGWSDGGSRRVMVFSLVGVPGKTAVVAPPQFYRQGIMAVMLDGDVVDANSSPTLYVVEEVEE